MCFSPSQFLAYSLHKAQLWVLFETLFPTARGKCTQNIDWISQCLYPSACFCLSRFSCFLESLPLWVSLILSKWLPTKITLGMSSPQLQLDSCYEGRPQTIHGARLPVFEKGLSSSENLLILLMADSRACKRLILSSIILRMIIAYFSCTKWIEVKIIVWRR